MTPGVIVAGLTLGLGAALIVSWFAARRPQLIDRVAPHVRGSLDDELRGRDVPVTPFPTLERLLAPIVRDAAKVVARWGASSTEVRHRLDRAGSDVSVEHFRAQQGLWALVGLAAGIVLAGVLGAARGAGVGPMLVVVASAAVTGAVARDLALSREVQRREARLLAELPTVAELLALAVSAGEGVLAALERVCRLTRGELSGELGRALAAARTGTPLPRALQSVGERTGLPALRRFVDGIATAVERGTPLAEVLRAQAQDVRSEGRQALMEEGGKREIAMMIPVVFLILPVSVVFAVFPGLVSIRLGF